MIEEWRPVVGFEGNYEVSDLGRVKSFAQRNNPGRIMKQQLGKPYPYWRVCLSKNGQQFMKFVHVLVAEAFIGPRPSGCQVRHGPLRNPDGSVNNSLTNLSYGTPAQNQADTERDGTKVRGSQKPQAKLTEEQVAEIRRTYAGQTWTSLAELYGVSDILIRGVVAGKIWTHAPGMPEPGASFNRKQKLSDEQVREIRMLSGEGIRNYQLAELYEVDRTTISHLLSGRTRANVEMLLPKVRSDFQFCLGFRSSYQHQRGVYSQGPGGLRPGPDGPRHLLAPADAQADDRGMERYIPQGGYR